MYKFFFLLLAFLLLPGCGSKQNNISTTVLFPAPTNFAPIITSSADYYQEKAKQANLTKNYSEGLKFSNQCLKLDPNIEDCWMHKGYAFYKLGNCTEAVVAMYHVIMNWPDDEAGTALSQQIYNSSECKGLKDSLEEKD